MSIFGKKRQHNPYDWAKAQDGNPESFSDVGISGALTGMDRQFRGINPFYKETDFGFDSFDRRSDTYKYGRGSTPSWQEGFYEPAFESAVRAPLRSVLGMTQEGWASNVGGSDSPEQNVNPNISPFMTLQEAFGGNLPDYIAQNIGQLDTSASTRAGYDGPVVAKESAPQLATLGAQRLLEQTTYDEAKEGFEIAREDEAKMKDEQMLDQRIARSQALSGRVDEYEKARAGQAMSGMSYSAPASREVEAVKEENIQELSDIKRQEYNIGEAYDKKIESIEADERDTDLQFASDTADYLGDIQSTLSAGKDKVIQDLTQAPENIRQAWDEWGQAKDTLVGQDSRGLMYGRNRYGAGYKGTGKNFQEMDFGDTAPEFALAGDLTTEANMLQQFIDQATGQTLEGITDII
tara:strand:- start:10237 stop:11457 length:1221 start_codon:yes stop_codon:yes gene_type:complete